MHHKIICNVCFWYYVHYVYSVCVCVHMLHIMLTRTEATKLYCERSPDFRISQGLKEGNSSTFLCLRMGYSLIFHRKKKSPTRKHFFVGYVYVFIPFGDTKGCLHLDGIKSTHGLFTWPKKTMCPESYWLLHQYKYTDWVLSKISTV